MTGRRTQRVVVGVDETPESRAALAFAMRECALRGSALDVITAWTPADGDDGAPGGVVDGQASPDRARQRAQRAQDTAVALTLQEVEARPLLSRSVLEGDAGPVLLRAARDADYLVVGTSRDDPLRPASMGSVSDYCVRNATCAVVVVQPPASKTKRQAAEGGQDVGRQRTTSGRLP